MAPKSNVPVRMLPRHLQKRKPNPNKRLTEPGKQKEKLPDLSQLVRPEALQGVANPYAQPQMYPTPVAPVQPTPGR